MMARSVRWTAPGGWPLGINAPLTAANIVVTRGFDDGAAYAEAGDVGVSVAGDHVLGGATLNGAPTPTR